MNTESYPRETPYARDEHPRRLRLLYKKLKWASRSVKCVVCGVGFFTFDLHSVLPRFRHILSLDGGVFRCSIRMKA